MEIIPAASTMSILVDTMRRLADENVDVCGGVLTAELMPLDADTCSVVIFQNNDCALMRFDIDHAKHRFRMSGAYYDDEEFGENDFAYFLKVASARVRDYR